MFSKNGLDLTTKYTRSCKLRLTYSQGWKETGVYRSNAIEKWGNSSDHFDHNNYHPITVLKKTTTSKQ